MTLRSDIDTKADEVFSEYKAYLVEKALQLAKDYKTWRDVEIQINEIAKGHGESTTYLAHVLNVIEPTEDRGLVIEWGKMHKKNAMAKALLARIKKGKAYLYDMKELKKGLDRDKETIWGHIEKYEYDASRIRQAWAEVGEAESNIGRALKAIDKLYTKPDSRNHRIRDKLNSATDQAGENPL